MMLRSVLKAGALAAASALLFLGGAAEAQNLSLRLGGVLGTEELATWAKNNFDAQGRQIDQIRRELEGARRELAERAGGFDRALQRDRDLTVADFKTISDALAKASDALIQVRVRSQELGQLIQAQERLRQELAEQMERRISGIATGVQQQVGRTREELNKALGESAQLRADIAQVQSIVSELQNDRREAERMLRRLQNEQMTLRNDVTTIESRKTELADLGNAVQKLQESSKADLDNAKGQSENVRVEMERRVGELTETLRQTQAAGEKAKLDFERQLSQIRAEFSSRVEEIRKEMNTQVTDTKKEVTEIKRSTAPVAVEVDGRAFEALPSERDSYLAAVSRVMNAPKAKTPREEFEAARADIQKFQDSVANPGFRGSSFYWLGMAQAGAGQCKEALVSFEEMRKLVDTARHPRYPAAMLQKATCQLMLKEPPERVNRSLRELVDQFPVSPEADTARTLLPAPAARKNR